MNETPIIATAPARVVRGRNGAVASPHHLATQAGLAVLRMGGSAVDAAIATNAALAVVAGAQCGLGGDAFWLIWDERTGRLSALNGSGGSGSAATLEAAGAAGHTRMPDVGPWTVTIPGAVASWGAAHAVHGRIDWSGLFGTAIELAAGFPADDAWSALVERAAGRFGVDGDWARTYRPSGATWHAGSIVRLERLAESLQTIADDGARVAYDGALAARTSAFFATQGVPISAADLDAYQPEWAEPIGIDYREVRSMAHPPNSVGVVSLQMLGMLARSAPAAGASFDGRGWDDPGWIHRGLEAARLGLAERDAHITDPDAMVAGTVERLLSDAHLDELSAGIDETAVMSPARSTLPPGGGTVYLATADRWGGVVSLLQSNFHAFGSGLVDPTTGICFQDRGAFFRLDPTHVNILAPNKRPTHTLTPGMLLRHGRPWIAHGSMGGEIQPQLFAQFVSAVVDGGADVATAVAAPRWAAMMPGLFEAPTISRLESRVPAAIVTQLRSRGHEVEMTEDWSSGMGHGHAIEIVESDGGSDDGRSFAAAADPRSEGSAAAF